MVEFSEGIGIRYYGMAYLLAFLLGALMLRLYDRAGYSLLKGEKVYDYIISLVLGVLIGARLGYFLFYTPEVLLETPLALFKVWDGGMSSHGGFIGVALASLIFSKRNRIPFFHLMDLTVSIAGIGLFLGRIANFINGELWGKITDVRWAVIFPGSAPGMPLELIPPRHPSQLYEALLEGLLLFAYSQIRFWRSNAVKMHPGRLCGEFLIIYAVARIICEIFREPDYGINLIFGLSRGTFYSIFLVIAGLAVILYSLRQPPILSQTHK